MAAIRDLFVKLGQVLAPGEYYRFKQSWQNHIRDLTTLLVLQHWLTANELLTLPLVATKLGMSVGDEDQVFTVELEDYLYGVACVPSELERVSWRVGGVGSNHVHHILFPVGYQFCDTRRL